MAVLKNLTNYIFRQFQENFASAHSQNNSSLSQKLRYIIE